MALTHITDFAARMAARVLSQYKPKPRLMALIGKLGDMGQEVEDAFWAMLVQFDYAQASGTWLDYLGGFVGEPRAGATDTAYRKFIEARIIANGSSGTIEDLIKVATLIGVASGAGPTVTVTESQIAGVLIEAADADLDDAALLARAKQLLSATKAGGVKVLFVYWPATADDRLFFFSADDTAPADTDHGFGDDGDPTVGGDFVDCIEA